MGNLHRCAAQVKIEIVLKLRGYFYLFISNHEHGAPQKLENTQNNDHSNIYIIVS